MITDDTTSKRLRLVELDCYAAESSISEGTIVCLCDNARLCPRSASDAGASAIQYVTVLCLVDFKLDHDTSTTTASGGPGALRVLKF